jgi:hypothetical protein
MAADDVYPAEMPDHPASPILPLDPDTAERLLAGRLDPADAPPGYAGVTGLLRAAAAPAHPDELAGEPAALAMFRAARSETAGSVGERGRPAGARGGGLAGERGRLRAVRRRPIGMRRSAGEQGRPVGARGRLVALALAGTLATGAVAVAGGLWTGADVDRSGRLGSPTGGAAAGGRGSGASGSGAGSGAVASWGVGAGDVRVAPTGEDGGRRRGDLRRRAGVASARERVTARRGGVNSRGGGSAHGIKPGRQVTQSKPKPNPDKGKPDKEKPAKAKPARN